MIIKKLMAIQIQQTMSNIYFTSTKKSL